MSDFLFEIGLDEIPARMIAGAEVELGRRVGDLLTRERLLTAASKVTTYSTPRRLAVVVEGVATGQADTEEQLTGPSWKVAFKDGAPTPAAEAFAKKAGVAVEALEKITNAKGEYVGATVKRLGPRSLGDSGNGVAQRSPRPSTGQRICTGARASRSALSAPFAGLSRCSITPIVPLEIAGHQGGQCQPRPSRVAWRKAPWF